MREKEARYVVYQTVKIISILFPKDDFIQKFKLKNSNNFNARPFSVCEMCHRIY